MKNYARFFFEHPRFLSFGLLLTLSSNFGQTFFINLFRDDFQATARLSDTQYGSLYSLATLFSGATLLWLGPRIDKVDLKRYSTFVCFGLIGACFFISRLPGRDDATSWVSVSVIYLFVAIYGLRLFGQGLPGHIASTSVTRYLAGARGKAMGVVSLGYPLGEAILPPLLLVLMSDYDWRARWLLIAGTLLLLLIPAVRILLHRHDERHAAHVERTKADQKSGSGQRQWTARDVLRDRRFYLILPAVLAPPFISTGIFFNGVKIAQEKEWSEAVYASSFTAYAIATVVASLFSGALADRVSPRRLAPFYLVPHAIALIALAAGAHPAFLFIYMLGAGLTAGGNGSIFGPLWPELYGVIHLGAIRTFMSSAMVFSTSASPFLMGYLTDQKVSTNAIAIGFLVCTVIASALCFVALREPDQEPGKKPEQGT